MIILQILGLLSLLTIYIIGVIYFRKLRAWLTYYLLAAFGFVLISVIALQVSGLDKYIETAEMVLVRYAAVPLGIKVGVLTPTTIQVNDAVGWVVLMMGIESSALIEASILIALVSFYPAFSWQKKVGYLAIGLVMTLIANIVRILIIVSMTHFLGRGTVFISHAIVGRLFFFACIIVLFWYILTRPTITEVSRIVREGKVD